MRRDILALVGFLFLLASSIATVPAVRAQYALTEEEQAYFDEMAPIVELLSESLPRAADLMTNPEIFSDDWKLALAVELVTWQSSYQEALTIFPPDSLSDVHAELIESLRLLDEAADDITVGIDELNADKIDLANYKMQLATTHMNTATELINEFALEHAA